MYASSGDYRSHNAQASNDARVFEEISHSSQMPQANARSNLTFW